MSNCDKKRYGEHNKILHNFYLTYICFLHFFLLYFYSRSIDQVMLGSGQLLSELHVTSLRLLLGLGDRPAPSLLSPLQSRVHNKFLNPSENPSPNTQIFAPSV